MAGAWMLCGLVACGGDAGTTPPVDEPAVAGRILVANDTPAAVEVAFLREDEGDGPRLVRTEVPAGATVDVSGGTALLPGGTQVELDLAFAAADGVGVRVRRKASVTVDGDTLVTVTLLDAGDPFSVAVAVGPAAGSA